jgi:hypothetical protein
VQLSYHLVKHYFLETFFPKYLNVDACNRLDFVCYVEVVMSYGIASSFAIGIFEWLCLFMVTLPVVVDFHVGSLRLRNYELFTVACVLLLVTAMTATLWLALIFKKILAFHFEVDVSSLVSLKDALQTVRNDAIEAAEAMAARESGSPKSGGLTVAQSRRSPSNSPMNGRANSLSRRASRSSLFVHAGNAWKSSRDLVATTRDKFYQNLVQNSHHLYELSHGLTLSDASSMKTIAKSHQSAKKTAVLWGIALTEFRLRKFIQTQLLVQSFYLSIFLCTYLSLYIEGKLPLFHLLTPVITLLLNVMLVTPCTMFLGYG